MISDAQVLGAMEVAHDAQESLNMFCTWCFTVSGQQCHGCRYVRTCAQ